MLFNVWEFWRKASSRMEVDTLSAVSNSLWRCGCCFKLHLAFTKLSSDRNAPGPETMPSEALPSTNEREFVLAALQQNVRIDGRAFDEFRSIDLAFGEDYGQADVRIGKTRVLVNVSAEVITPYPDRKFDGVFTISTELSPIASPAFEVGRYGQADLAVDKEGMD